MGTGGKKVVVAMSGGVDSSVAAALLLREGYDVMGVFMRLGSPKGVESHDAEVDAEACDPSGKSKQGCCSVLDAVDARRVAGMLGIPFYVLNFEADFGRVIDYFVSEYNLGRTPNPCVRCNDWLKFGKLTQYAKAVGADYVASGHYARIGIDPGTGRKALLRGRDHRKDQSYVLFGMNREAIEHTLLPIGEFEKSRVRELAEEFKLPVYNKPDSQEICFVPDQDYAALVKRRSPESFRQGEIVNTGGKVLGKHEGHQHFTIGQRKGMGVAVGHPLYVLQIDPQANRVTLGERDELLKTELVADQINLLSARMVLPPLLLAGSEQSRTGEGRGEGDSEKQNCTDSPRPLTVTLSQRERGPEVRCQAKIRYNHQPQPAIATVTGQDELTVRFESPQPAITPGQAVVLYDGDVVLGGGWIQRAS